MTEHYGPRVTPTVSEIRELAAEGKVMLTAHATRRMFERCISTARLIAALSRCEMLDHGIENDPRGPEIRVVGPQDDDDPLVVVCGMREDNDGRSVIVISLWRMWEANRWTQ